MDFVIEIVGISAITDAFRQAPAIMAPIIQRALAASQAILAKHTTKDTVPWKSGFLTQTFQAVLTAGTLHWYPTASYARFVEDGTAPHVIEPKNASALYWSGAQHPVKIVHHPGTKANPYMERIVEASQDEINQMFGTALKQMTAALSTRS